MCSGKCERVTLFVNNCEVMSWGLGGGQINWMNKKVVEDDGKRGTQDNGKFRKICRFLRNDFWKKIGCLLSAPTFGLGWLILWERYLNVSVRNRERSLILQKVDYYEVCVSLFQIIYYCYYFYTHTYFTSSGFVA